MARTAVAVVVLGLGAVVYVVATAGAVKAGERGAGAGRLECPDNRLVNPGFENGFGAQRRPVEIVANGWSAWYKVLPGLDGINYAPEYTPRLSRRDGAAYVQSGQWSQEMATQGATHTAGIWQRVYVPPDSLVRATVWADAWATNGQNPARSEPPGTYALMLGIDPRGGDDPHARRVAWTEPITITDTWLPLTLEVPVEGPVITLFTRGQPLQRLAHNVSRWDSACLRVIGRAGEPPLTATPRPWPTRTPGPGTVTATPGRATLQAIEARRHLELIATATARAVPRSVTAPDPTLDALATRLAGGLPSDGDQPGSEDAPLEDEQPPPISEHLGLVMLVLAAFAAGLVAGLGRPTR